MRKCFDWLVKKKDIYTPIIDDDYYKSFGIDITVTPEVIIDRAKLKSAYEKAWEIRTFEIDKFWTRSAYFWGFIALIFGGYIAILTGKETSKGHTHIILYLLLLGCLFSITWYLVIRGSKSWQQNWEAHIDKLENYISGPLYKTIYYSGIRFYSVSKLSEVMAIVVILVWFGLLIEFLIENYTLSLGENTDWASSIALFIASIFAVVLTCGYCSGSYISKKNSFIDRGEY